jgi:hypothetical protein
MLRRTTVIVAPAQTILLDSEKLNGQEWDFSLSAKKGTLSAGGQSSEFNMRDIEVPRR